MEWPTEDRDGERLPGWQPIGAVVCRLDAAGARNYDSLLVGDAEGSCEIGIAKALLAERVANVLNGMEVFMLGESQAKAWVLHCSTGCSCCRSDNFYAGPFRTKEEARAQAQSFSRSARLSSQYSSSGNYYVEEVDLVEIGPVLIIDGWYACKEWGSTYMDNYKEGT